MKFLRLLLLRVKIISSYSHTLYIRFIFKRTLVSFFPRHLNSQYLNFEFSVICTISPTQEIIVFKSNSKKDLSLLTQALLQNPEITANILLFTVQMLFLNYYKLTLLFIMDEVKSKLLLSVCTLVLLSTNNVIFRWTYKPLSSQEKISSKPTTFWSRYAASLSFTLQQSSWFPTSLHKSRRWRYRG